MKPTSLLLVTLTILVTAIITVQRSGGSCNEDGDDLLEGGDLIVEVELEAKEDKGDDKKPPEPHQEKPHSYDHYQSQGPRMGRPRPMGYAPNYGGNYGPRGGYSSRHPPQPIYCHHSNDCPCSFHCFGNYCRQCSVDKCCGHGMYCDKVLFTCNYL